MNPNRCLAIVAVVIFGVAGLAFAQKKDEGPQSAQPVVQADAGTPATACPCGHGSVAACHAMATPTGKDRRTANSDQKVTGKQRSTEQEGDPDAPQNHVEYGGGG